MEEILRNMNAGDVNALLMLGFVALSISIPSSLGMKPNGILPWIVGILGGLGLLGFLVDRFVHLSLDGQPYRQIILASLCFTVTLISVGRLVLQVTLALLLVPAAFFMTAQYNALVHGTEFTGNPEVVGVRNAEREEKVLEELKTQLPAGIALGPEEGWLLELPVGKALPEPAQASLNDLRRDEAHPVWHSPITGLYDITHKPMALWYAGDGNLEFVPMDSKLEKRPSSAPYKKPKPLLSDKSVYQ